MNVISEVKTASIPTVIVKYGGCRLLPAPLIDFRVEPIFDDSGSRTATRTSLTLDGTILAIPSGSYEVMYGKQEELRTMFATDDLDFLILAGPANKTLAEGTVICSGLKPKVISLNIEPAVQVDRFDYTVELEDVTAASGVSGVVSSFSNQWQFSENQEACVLEVTHTVSAQGLPGESDAFEQAVRKVKPELGISNLPIQLPCFVEPNFSGAFGMTHPSNPLGGPVFEISVQREESADVANGTYTVTEVFSIVSGVPFYFTQKNTSFAEDENGIATVTIQGTVQGLGRTNTPGLGLDGGVGYQRACSGFINQIRPILPNLANDTYLKFKEGSSNSGSGLVTTNPQSISVTENKCQGTIAFAFAYTDNPQAALPSGITDSQNSVQRTDPIHVYAVHPIPLRRIGPILQDINTTTEGQVVVQAQATAKNTGNKTGDTNRVILYVQEELNRLRGIHASPGNFLTLRVISLVQNISDSGLTCNASITYAFTADLAETPSADSDIILETI